MIQQLYFPLKIKKTSLEIFNCRRKNSESWIDFALSLTFSLSTFVRGNEYRAIRYPYIRLDQNGLHCPYPNGPMSTCLINIREPNTTKTKNSMKTTTGGWRHKEFFLCWHAMLAFKICMRMSELLPEEIKEFFLLQNHSYYKKKNLKDMSKPPFYEYFISKWKNHQHNAGDDVGSRAMGLAYKKELIGNNVIRNKVTGVRSDGMSNALNSGTPKHNINMLSGHISSKDVSEKHYYVPVNKAVCHSCSGFSYNPREEYFIPRCIIVHNLLNTYKSNIGFDYLTFWTNKLFPMISEFRSIMQSPPPNRKLYSGSSVSSFVNEILPYYSRVMIEDGVMWTKLYPQHVFSKLLRQKLPFYSNFVEIAYPQIEQLTKQYVSSPYSLQHKTSELAMGRLPCHPVISGICENFQKQIIPSMFLMNQVFSMSQSLQRINNYIENQQLQTARIEEKKDNQVCSHNENVNIDSPYGKYTIPLGNTPKLVSEIIKYHISNQLYHCTKWKSTSLGWSTSEQRKWKVRQDIFTIVYERVYSEIPSEDYSITEDGKKIGKGS